MGTKETISKREYIEIQTKVMRLPESEALDYLARQGFKIKRAQYYKDLSRIASKTEERAMEIAQRGFLEQHLTRIDTLITIEQEMWKNYNAIEDNYKKNLVLESIVKLQPYLSGAYSKTRIVMEKQTELKAKQLVAPHAS